MSLNKSIRHNKEHRRQYYDSRAIDATCRSHGSCPWCQNNRRHKIKVKEERLRQDLNFFLNNA